MSYALMNLWVRDENCNLLFNAWRMDLVVMTCSGKYLVDMDENTLDNLRKRYPDFEKIEILPFYQGYKRINIMPNTGDHIYHLEMDLPPGCYKIWARMCHGKNEETNKVMVIAQCGQEICVNLLLDSPNICAGRNVFPMAVAGLIKQQPREMVKDQIRVMQNVAVIPQQQMRDMADARVQEFVDAPADIQWLRPYNEEVRNIVYELPEIGCCGADPV